MWVYFVLEKKMGLTGLWWIIIDKMFTCKVTIPITMKSLMKVCILLKICIYKNHCKIIDNKIMFIFRVLSQLNACFYSDEIITSFNNMLN